MRAEPQSNALTLSQPARFSLGAGTQIVSVHIELKDIRLRDLPPGYLPTDKRKWAMEEAERRAREIFIEKFGEEGIVPGVGDPISFMHLHEQDAVTFEIWKQGPEYRRVKMNLTAPKEN